MAEEERGGVEGKEKEEEKGKEKKEIVERKDDDVQITCKPGAPPDILQVMKTLIWCPTKLPRGHTRKHILRFEKKVPFENFKKGHEFLTSTKGISLLRTEKRIEYHCVDGRVFSVSSCTGSDKVRWFTRHVKVLHRVETPAAAALLHEIISESDVHSTPSVERVEATWRFETTLDMGCVVTFCSKRTASTSDITILDSWAKKRATAIQLLQDCVNAKKQPDAYFMSVSWSPCELKRYKRLPLLSMEIESRPMTPIPYPSTLPITYSLLRKYYDPFECRLDLLEKGCLDQINGDDDDEDEQKENEKEKEEDGNCIITKLYSDAELTDAAEVFKAFVSIFRTGCGDPPAKSSRSVLSSQVQQMLSRYTLPV
jgi:hypothetical protein